MHSRCFCGHDALVIGPVRLVLTLEFTAVAETVEGLVHAADHSAHTFSGWSELFAVLMELTSGEEGNQSHRTLGQPAP
jgi:hypothetical protein